MKKILALLNGFYLGNSFLSVALGAAIVALLWCALAIAFVFGAWVANILEEEPYPRLEVLGAILLVALGIFLLVFGWPAYLAIAAIVWTILTAMTMPRPDPAH